MDAGWPRWKLTAQWTATLIQRRCARRSVRVIADVRRLHFGAWLTDTLSTQFNSREALRMAIRLTRNLGMLLLAIWLILTGLMPLLSLSFQGVGTIMAILAIAAGVLLLIGR